MEICLGIFSIEVTLGSEKILEYYAKSDSDANEKKVAKFFFFFHLFPENKK